MNKDTQITPETRKDLKQRGKGKQTLILDAIKEAAVFELGSDASRDDTEKAMFKHMAKAAFKTSSEEPQMQSVCLNLLMKKGWPDLKSTAPMIEFDFPEGGKPHEQANAVMIAISNGLVPPDLGAMFIGSIKAMIDIEESTDIKHRLEMLEKAMGEGE